MYTVLDKSDYVVKQRDRDIKNCKWMDKIYDGYNGQTISNLTNLD